MKVYDYSLEMHAPRHGWLKQSLARQRKLVQQIEALCRFWCAHKDRAGSCLNAPDENGSEYNADGAIHGKTNERLNARLHGAGTDIRLRTPQGPSDNPCREF
jgi:hypothetical protein